MKSIQIVLLLTISTIGVSFDKMPRSEKTQAIINESEKDLTISAPPDTCQYCILYCSNSGYESICYEHNPQGWGCTCWRGEPQTICGVKQCPRT